MPETPISEPPISEPPISELARFQAAFAEALRGDAAALSAWIDPARPDGEARLSVHRNTVAKGWADALAAQFPTAARALGEERMRATALRFAREQPPRTPVLMAYGEGFPGWLAATAPTSDLPWLAGLARIDWARRDALFAADAPPLAPDALAEIAPEAYARTSLGLHPSAAVFWFEDGTAALWRALQADPPPTELELALEPGGLLLVRPGLEVVHRPLGRGAYAFLQACRARRTLAEAGADALAAEPALPLAALFADLLALGAFARTPARDFRPG
jgi:hypothetical protein